PVAAYSFDEGKGKVVNDLVGENDGTIEGAEWTEEGKYGSALLFDGSSQVTIPDSGSLDLTEGFTLEAWVRPHLSADEWGPVFDKEDSASPGYGYELYATTNRWWDSPSNLPSAYL